MKDLDRNRLWTQLCLLGSVAALCFALFSSVATTASANVAFANKLIDSQDHGYNYGYGPSIIYQNNRFYAFYCSDGAGTPGLDSIRLSTSGDGRTWDAPQRVLTALGRDVEGAACDPSIVRYQAPGDSQPYYYLFYGGTVTGIETLMFVARSSAIEGPYAKWTTSGTWEVNAENPQPIILPMNPTEGSYGAGQPSVVVTGGKLRMWFIDSTCGCGLLTATTSSPTQWPEGSAVNESGDPVWEGSVDVKFDPQIGEFRMFVIHVNHEPTVSITERTSADGMTWTGPTTICSGSCVPSYSNNLGISGDPSGNLISGRGLMMYGSPYDQRPDYTNEGCPGDNCWGHWDLYGSVLNPAGEVWNDIPWGWQWFGMNSSHKLALGDYDGDGKTDRAIVDQTQSGTGYWYTIPSSNPSIQEFVWSGMQSTARLALGDYDGDGKTDRAIVEDGYVNGSRWYVVPSSGVSPFEWGWQWWGMNSSLKLALGDYDGDGKTDRAIVDQISDPSNARWLTIPSSNPNMEEFKWWGMSSAMRLAVGDYDGDERTDRASIDDGAANGSLWFVMPSSGVSPFEWGWQWWGMNSSHKLALGDYDGDGKTDRAIVDQAQAGTGYWYTIPSSSPNIHEFVWHGMQSTARLAPGDYDGDGKTDRAIVEDGISGGSRWYIVPSSPFQVY